MPSSTSIPESKYQANVRTDEELDALVKEDEIWLESVKKLENTDKHNISYAAFHANRINEKRNHADISALMPIWRKDSKSLAVIKHALDAIAYLNPGQFPVVAFNQPLYSIAKQLQWY